MYIETVVAILSCGLKLYSSRLKAFLVDCFDYFLRNGLSMLGSTKLVSGCSVAAKTTLQDDYDSASAHSAGTSGSLER